MASVGQKGGFETYAGPYERWVFSPALGRPFAFPAVRRPSSIMAAILEGGGDPHALENAEVRIPPLWRPDAQPPAAVPFAFRDLDTEDVSDETLTRCLGAFTHGKDTSRVRLNLPVPELTWPATYDPDSAAEHWREPDVRPTAIVAVIDDGLPFANRAFLAANGNTRISHLWLQSARAREADRVPFGREYANGEIDDLRAGFGTDERALYRACGAIDSEIHELGSVLDQRATHGAHILGLAAGNSAFAELPAQGDEVAIIGVQLPNTVAWDTSGFGKETYMLAALHYVFARAQELSDAIGAQAPLPLIVNLSYGWNAGRHDGDSVVETEIEALLQSRRALQPKTAIVLPMGNHFDAEMHAEIDSAGFVEGRARIGWALPPDDRTSSYLELWLPDGFDPAGWSVRVIPPSGTVLESDRIDISPDDALCASGDPRRYASILIGGRTIGQLSADLDRGSRWRVLIALIPTAETGTARRCPSGTWQVEINRGTGDGLADGEMVELWVQRDDDPRALGMGGRQSYLVGPYVTGFGAMSAIASAPSATRIAGVIAGTSRPAPYSGAASVRQDGDASKASRAEPTVAAPSEQSDLIGGIRSIGVVTGSGSRVTGTSAAAALASRWMVTNAAAGREMFDGLVALADAPDDDPAQRQARLGGGLVP
ncbi:hypothetical protein [Maritimibacter dapengensis]|uniref:Subtilase family protein n=1 Tax=Maritimibacter dapengensis TaxID=2836868 RepID=A0ABS6SXF4_9RHOB|nr:hypothetical protein [Maritimibacter dapengensis]MBV7377622.1 hypothetical protein [Maritimibacter dapengensis]